MEKPQILCYALPMSVKAALATLARRFGVVLRTVPTEAYTMPLAAVAAGLEPKRTDTEKILPEPMLVFVSFPETMLDSFLAAMREKGPRVSLKAVLTRYNAIWTAEELYRELCRERNALH